MKNRYKYALSASPITENTSELQGELAWMKTKYEPISGSFGLSISLCIFISATKQNNIPSTQ